MVLSPSEKSPVILLRWTAKAQKHSELMGLVRKELAQNRILVVPTVSSGTSGTGTTTTISMTASQESLEEQAEYDHLIKRRRIPGESSVQEVVMDHFSRRHRTEFCNNFGDNNNKNSRRGRLDAEGLFSVHERCHLVLGLIDRISVSNNPKLLHILLEDPETTPQKESITSLRYLLEKHEWIDVLISLHIDHFKTTIQKNTWYPVWQMMPPVDEIYDYYGPSIAYYFAFVGFLGTWLGRLGVLGLSSFLLRWYRNDTIDEDEVSSSTQLFIMHQQRSRSIAVLALTHLAPILSFQYTPFYGLVCFLWALLLYRFWERKENELAYKWGTLELSNMANNGGPQDYSSLGGGENGGIYAHRRPEFKGQTRTSPVTGKPELYYPSHKRKLQYLGSAVVTALMLSVAFSVMILSLNLQGYIRPSNSQQYHPFYFAQFAVLSEEGAWFDVASSWKYFIPIILHAVSILTLNTIYRGVARKLTGWENHETQTAYENSLILKRFLFEAFDCYIVLFYLAFYERDVERLRVELVAVFNIDSFRRLGTETILPYILRFRINNPKVSGNTDHRPRDLHLDEYEQFDDYMEVLIQFGYVVVFASAYPLASLLMAGAMWLEMRSDIHKLTNVCQKPLSGERIHNLGVWKTILQFMVWFSCLTNCLLFGFTSDQMMHYMPDFYIRDAEGVTHMIQDKGWIAILIIFCLERILLFGGLVLHSMIPAMPESLLIQLQRRKYLLARNSKKID
jgi:anoctamin-10